MSVPPKLKTQFIARFDELISIGENILNNQIVVPPPIERDSMTGMLYVTEAPSYQLNWSKLVEWRTKSATLLSQMPLKGSVHQNAANNFLEVAAPSMEAGIATLRALKDDFEKGFLDNLFLRIEAEIASDFMGQAEKLLGEGVSGRFDYVPAAVLAGAVLEKGLRKLCETAVPPIPITKPNGEAKTLSPLIEDLKQSGAFTELRAKQLRTWAAIRNKAAHGEFDQFTRTDVEQMVPGISNFLAEQFG